MFPKVAGRSREGAWIEMANNMIVQSMQGVAPVRERGLKSVFLIIFLSEVFCRSREGAWIEIMCCGITTCLDSSRSREGAWIEILNEVINYVKQNVAPVRERGLKFCQRRNVGKMGESLP